MLLMTLLSHLSIFFRRLLVVEYSIIFLCGFRRPYFPSISFPVDITLLDVVLPWVSLSIRRETNTAQAQK